MLDRTKLICNILYRAGSKMCNTSIALPACKKSKSKSRRDKRRFKSVVELRVNSAKTMRLCDSENLHVPKFWAEFADEIHCRRLSKESERFVEAYGDPSKLTQYPISQPHRVKLVNFLHSWFKAFNLVDPNTLYMGIQVLDRFSHKNLVSPKNLQLTGCTCLLLAEKYEEIYPTQMETYSKQSGRAFNKRDMILAELVISKAIEYK